MAQNSRQKGMTGEDKAVLFLEKNGYNIVKRNYTCRFGEIDIIAENKDFLVFVEVKFRKNIKSGYPREAVNYKKQSKIKTTALSYISENNILERAMRFDVIEIIDNKIEHIENAFWKR